MNRWLHTTAVLASLALAAAATGAGSQAYRDASLSAERRATDLLARMTLEEKVAQLEAQGMMPALSPNAAPTALGLIADGRIDETIARRTLGSGMGAFMVVGLDPIGAAETARQQNLIQDWVLRNTRLGIPILFQGEALHGAVLGGATSFPQAIGLGSTWDPDLLRRAFDVAGREARAAGIAQVLAPVLDLARDPRFGRSEEMYSEDPYLAGTLGVAAVRGLQGGIAAIAPDHVIATAKHFVHGQPENGTNRGPSDYSERTMRAVFLTPFEMAVKSAGIGAVMASYNENDGGVPSHASRWLLTGVLRDEWKFGGMTVSDWSGIPLLHDELYLAPTKEAAGRIALDAGVDVELPTPVSYPSLVEDARQGRVRMAAIDAAVSRVLAAKFRAGLFEHPMADPAAIAATVGTDANARIARAVADEAIVLLKNQGGLLPLDPARVKSIAVIGPNADKVRLGTYSGKPAHYVTVLEGIRRRVGPDVAVRYAEGVRLSEPDDSPYVNRIRPYAAPAAARDAQLIAEAVAAARSADVVILALGGNESVSREAFGPALGNPAAVLGDSDTLELPGRQNELVRALAPLGKPTVAVLLNGRPYSPVELDKAVPAIVEGWYLGQETGNAVAGVLFGDTNPSGRLPVTIARNVGQLPAYYYRSPIGRMGYVFSDNAPLYPFGFGLSYTSFAMTPPTVDRPTIRRVGSARVTVSVTNTGARAGDEVVQMYLRLRYASVVQPVQRLAGFRRVHLAAGETRAVSFDVGPEQLAIWGADMKRAVEPGQVEIMIGANAADTKSVALAVSD